MSSMLRLAVIDDHPLFREGVVRSLSDFGFQIVGEGGSRDESLTIVRDQRPDILLLDISMPGGGLESIEPILAACPDQKIIMLTVSEALQDAARAFRSGVKGYVLKGVGARTLAQIVTAVARGETYVPPTLSAQMMSALARPRQERTRSEILAELTQRETQILELVSKGLSNKHVARQLDLQEKTVKHHMTRILAKLNASNRTEAAIFFRETRPVS